MTLPQDPFMLLSVVNTYLRDKYTSLDELCEIENINKEELIKSLSVAGFEYSEENNKFW
ncbi:MAG: DUF4250 domain-containing protein [Bacteroidaceae bacterium]|nr:DUF4250 domain-containing protein [Bacteroidaceae bacterium]